MSTVLPIKESARELILEATDALQPHFSEMTAALAPADVRGVPVRRARHGGFGEVESRRWLHAVQPLGFQRV